MPAETNFFPDGEWPFDPDPDFLFQTDPLDPAVFPEDTLPFDPNALEKATSDVADFNANFTESAKLIRPVNPLHLNYLMQLAREWKEEVVEWDDDAGTESSAGEEGSGYPFLLFLIDQIDLKRDDVAVWITGNTVPFDQPRILLSEQQTSVLNALYDVTIPTQDNDVKQMAEITLLGKGDTPIAQVEVQIAYKPNLQPRQPSAVVFSSAAVDLFNTVAATDGYTIVITKIYSSLEDSTLFEEDRRLSKRHRRQRGPGDSSLNSAES